MNHILKRCVLGAFVAVSVSHSAVAATNVHGYITTNTEWTLANSPYVVTSTVLVENGATLTIDRGVVVKFSGQFNTLTVNSNSTLIAVGTADSAITFTSVKDDSVGGDTNGDGNATSPAPGDWYYVGVSGSATLDYVVMSYGGYGSSDHAYGALSASGAGAVVTVDHSHFFANQRSGIVLGFNATTYVTHTEVNGNANGLSVTNANLAVNLACNIHNNTDVGVWVDSAGYTGTPTSVQNSDITNNSNYGVDLLVEGATLNRGARRNIYNNNIGVLSDQRQLYSLYATWTASWTGNYWGPVTEKECDLDSFGTKSHL